METSHDGAAEMPRIGSYRLVRELGRGGQAVVWLAEDRRIGRQVALKVLPPLGPGGEGALARFRREAEVTARLEHAGICAVLEADLDRGTPFIAMRFVAGETLAARIERARAAGAAPPDLEALRELASLFEKAARALHAAHQAGVVHRDVKPANLMVTPEAEPVILDFGLARDDESGAPALSLSGEVSGTPAYMSPEQMTGRARPDRRADVWSLGVALYEAATLAHPFAAATREGLYQAILERDPDEPRRHNRAIDRDLATILETATAKERDRRYQTAEDLAEDLRRWRAHEPIRARPAGRVERLARWVQRKPALAASLAAASVLALAASALLAYGVAASGRAGVEAALRSDAEAARAVAEAERGRAEAERERAESARASLARAQADRALAAELDELDMQMGTLWFGLNARDSVGALAPRYLAAFRAWGVDLEDEVAAGSIGARIADLRARDGELARGVLQGLRNLSTVLAGDGGSAAVRQRVDGALASFPEASWPELEAAVRRWESERVDGFAELLAAPALEDRTAEQLHRLASVLFVTPGRVADAQCVLERSLALDPGSFRLHFQVAATGLAGVQAAFAADPAEARRQAGRAVHHMQVATALRPRSGFVRAMLATALALEQRYDEAVATIDAATELEPENAMVWTLRARFYAHTPWVDRAIEACRRAIELDPWLPEPVKLLEQLEARGKGAR